MLICFIIDISSAMYDRLLFITLLGFILIHDGGAWAE